MRQLVMIRPLPAVFAAAFCFLMIPRPGVGQERLCDTQFEDCRAPLLQLIRNEQVAIDVALWFIEDERYATELINRHNARVPVRVLVDQRAVNSYPRYHPGIVARLRDAGIPLREKYAGGILHFKTMIFHGQNMLEFSKANYTDFSFVPAVPNADYFDETIYFTNDHRLTASFRRRFDDLWVNTTQYRNLANIAGPLERRCPTCTIEPSMNFPPLEDYANRSVARYNRETHGIDAVVFRATDRRQPEALIGAVARGVPVRVITEPAEYRNPERLWHAKYVDRMWLGGVQIKHRQHAGLTHQASVVLRGLGEVIFGSSNWTSASASRQDEHNYFYHPGLQKPGLFQWFVDQFDNKWNDGANYVPFQPLPPDNPVYHSPAAGAVGQSPSVTLTWDGGMWAHLYDIYFGTSPDPPLIAAGVEIGSPAAGQRETYTVINLQPQTTYYWRVVSKTWAQVPNSGSVSSFTTGGTPSSTTPPPPIGATFPESALVWHHAGTGNVVAWLMAGTTMASHAVIGQASPIWRIVGRGHFNGDGELDLVWQHSTNGSVVVWFMRGTTYLQSVVAGGVSDTTWRVVAADDFNRDGGADLVWYNNRTGNVVIWIMNGTQYVRGTTVGSVGDLNWRLSGATDLDSDGDPDFVWHHPPSGAVIAWLLNGTTYVGGAVMGSVSDPNWRIVGAADFDGDRFGDLIWYHQNQQTVVVWLMHRATYRTGVAIGQVSDPNWRLEAPR